MEQREIRVQNIEFRSNITDSGEMVISGYVNETEEFSDPLSIGDGHSYFIEKIKKGAFQRAIDKTMQTGFDIDFLAEHDDEKILASTRNDSLYLTEDEKGLFISAVITPTSWGKDFYQLVSNGIIRNFSFGFRAIDDEWNFSNDGIHTREVKELELFEVSLVRHPAYPQSLAEARGITSSETIYKNELRRFKENMNKEKIEKREEEQEEKEETTLDVTETIISIDAKLELIERKLDEVLGLFLEETEVEQKEEEKETEEEKTEEKTEDIDEEEREESQEKEEVEERDEKSFEEINKRAIELIKESLK